MTLSLLITIVLVLVVLGGSLSDRDLHSDGSADWCGIRVVIVIALCPDC
jgi:hypothetical protein